MFDFTKKASNAGYTEAKLRALDCLSANVMLADNDLNITYVNKALKNFLKEAERDILKDLPSFSVDRLIGANIDVFHKNPAHQRGLLSGLSVPYETSIRVGGRTFGFKAQPLYDDRGNRTGFMVEWSDSHALDNAGQVAAIRRALAVVEFEVDGVIIDANENFCSALGYGLQELKGKPHSMLVDPAIRNSAEYRMFWDKLRQGEFQVENSDGLEKTEKPSGSTPLTILFLTCAAVFSKLSNTRLLSPTMSN